MEVCFVAINTHVEALEEPIIPKPIPLVIPNIGVGTKVTLINTITHASEVLKIQDIILKDTPIAKNQDFN
jgi:hypothetical protein